MFRNIILGGIQMVEIGDRQRLTGTNQHYVSRLLLRPFETDTRWGRRVWVLDTKTMRIRARAISAIASAPGFYDTEGGSLDGSVTKFENDLGGVLNRVRKSGSLVDLDEISQRILSLGLATQYIRTKRMRTILERCAAGTLGDERRGYGPETADWYAKDYGTLSPRDVQLEWLSRWAFQLASLFFKKTWLLIRPTGGFEFITSDHPVINRIEVERDPSQLGELGALYLPIAPQLAIAFVPRHVAMSGDRSIRFVGSQMQIPVAEASIDQTETHLINTLQLENADRFIISNRQDLLVAAQESNPRR